MRLLLSVACIVFAASPALAQCRPPRDSSEARLQYYYAVPLSFSMPATARDLSTGAIAIGGDLTYIPDASGELRTTRLCYDPDKTESSDLAPVLPRPRLAIGLPLGLVAEVSYLPPVTVGGATPNLFSGAVSARVFDGVLGALPARLVVRGHFTVGRVEGAITCSKDRIQQTQPTQPCWGRNPSDDRYEPNIRGLEAALITASPVRGMGAYIGAGATYFAPEFQVNFTFQDGVNRDTTRVVPERVTRAVLMAAGWFRPMSRLDLGLQLYSVPADLTVLRAGGSLRLR
jgi:hypothetical protein